MKVFISQPMRGKTEDEILSERNVLIKKIKELFSDKEIEIIDSIFTPEKQPPLWYLGQSLLLLSTADLAVFTTGWNEYRGCRIEHECCVEYGIKFIHI